MSDLGSDSLAFYLTDLSPKDKPWDVHKAEAEQVKSLYREAFYERYADRISKCSRILGFKSEILEDETHTFKLGSVQFCRVRFCPICQWRKTLVWCARFYQALPKVIERYPKARWIFLTLTVKNCPLEELRDTVKTMNKAWTRLSQRAEFPAHGWVKSLEVTRVWDCYDGSTFVGRHGSTWVEKWQQKNKRELKLIATNETHPHFHALLLVPSSYFSDKYVRHSRWVELWQQCLRADYEPSVHIRRVDWDSKTVQISNDRYNPSDSVADLGRIDVPEWIDMSKYLIHAVLEVLKYQVKPSDMLASADPRWIEGITRQLHNTRSVAVGGVLKEYLSQEEPENEEMIHPDEFEGIDNDEIRFWFGWRENTQRYTHILDK